MNCTATLKTASILQVPFDSYPKDFTFIVNNEEFHTHKIFADLISNKISKLHTIDPTIFFYEIHTKSRGNFQTILDINKTNQIEISNNDLSFFSEIYELLEINVNINHQYEEEITVDNVIDRIKFHEKSPNFYSDILNTEIEFATTNFYILKEKQEENLFSLSMKSLENILNKGSLKLESENQLLEFINDLYAQDCKYSKFYEFVLFLNVETNVIEEFISIFDINDITREIWSSISIRLKQKLNNYDENSHNLNRYIKRGLDLSFKGQEFKGIFNHFQKQSNIESEVNLTASSKGGGDLKNLIQLDNLNNYFYTSNVENSWICFELKNHSIIPTHYTLRSEKSNGVGGNHPKSWVIEVSNDSNDTNSWTKIDEQKDNSILNGSNYVHTFPIKNHISKNYKFIRMRITGPSWDGRNMILLNSVEFYGQMM